VNVLEVGPAPPRFHARHDAVSRTYLYRISRRRTAFDKRLVWWIKDRLNFTSMKNAAKLFEGQHDFASFCENPQGQESTVVVVEKSDLLDWEHEIHFRIEASHFLWKMVRRLAGTLVEVGRGTSTPPASSAPAREVRRCPRNGPRLRRACFWKKSHIPRRQAAAS
jgi:tRNA pseudouridine38-40 synthase